MDEILVQAFGFLGLSFFVLSYQIRSPRALFLCQLLGCIVFCLQMCMLGAYTGAMALLVNILRNFLLLKVKDWPWVSRKATLLAVLFLLITVTALTWDGCLSLLPLASVGISTVGYWTNDARKLRISQLFASPCTLVYDVFIRSWGGAISEGISLVSILISIYRFGFHRRETAE